jgi:hypothetical protein
LRVHFKGELEYILQAVKAVNNNLTQSLHESQEAQVLFALEDDVSKSSGGELQIRTWCELLDTRPRLYAGLIQTLDIVMSWGGTVG